MKSLTSLIGLLSLCVLFIGCPYESYVPIDKPFVKINPKLLGSWTVNENKGEEYKISKRDEFTYLIEYTENKKSSDYGPFLAYASIVNGVTFLNLWENKASETSHPYSFYKLEITSDSKITLFEVTENVDEKFASSDELKTFIAANMHTSYFFGKEPRELFRIRK